MPVRGVPVPDELAGELDLVGRVVHVEPRRPSRARPTWSIVAGTAIRRITATQVAVRTHGRQTARPPRQRARPPPRARRRAGPASGRRRDPTCRPRRGRAARGRRAPRWAAAGTAMRRSRARGRSTATRAPSTPSTAKAARRSMPRAAHAVTRAPRHRRLRGEEARRDSEHEPCDRVLEEAAVEERVHEERDEDGGKREPEGLLDPEHAQQRLGGADEQRRVEREPDDAELGSDGERRRVRDEERRRAAVLRHRLTRPRLRAEADAHERVLPEHLRRQVDAPRAVARRHVASKRPRPCRRRRRRRRRGRARRCRPRRCGRRGRPPRPR